MYNMMYRWYRDGVPTVGNVAQNQDEQLAYASLGPSGVIEPVLTGIRSEVQIMNAQSTQSRYINPATSTYLKTSLYASTM